MLFVRHYELWGRADPAQHEAEYNSRRNRPPAATGYAENAAIGNGHLKPGMQVLTKPFAMGTLTRRIKVSLPKRGSLSLWGVA
jgi:hypothetical protein